MKKCHIHTERFAHDKFYCSCYFLGEIANELYMKIRPLIMGGISGTFIPSIPRPGTKSHKKKNVRNKKFENMSNSGVGSNAVLVIMFSAELIL